MDIPRNWRLREQRYRLEGTRCTECAALYFPPREVCRACRSRALEPYLFQGEGTLFSYTVVYQAPEGFGEQVPYAVGLVELAEGPRLTAMLSDVELDELAIGLPLEMVIRKITEEGETGMISYGYKFRIRGSLSSTFH
ncbi:MAG: Zn-ribbon domain-containing OB-fold protein [Ardenticatenales bacterium]|nr:Zn-ribbon domain-containing OB-fold protein [Ardenticatenales bacterium]